MNDQPTTDGDDRPDDHVVEALRDVAPTPPDVRRAHVDAALAEYDRLATNTASDPAGSVAPVPLRRRSTRVLQVAAAVALVVVGAAVVVRVGTGTAQDDRASSGAESVTASDAERGDGAGGAVDSTLAPTRDASAATSESDAALQGPGPEPPADLGTFATVEGVIAVLGTSPAAVGDFGNRTAGDDDTVGPCAAPAGLGPVPELAGIATVAGERRLVWV